MLDLFPKLKKYCIYLDRQIMINIRRTIFFVIVFLIKMKVVLFSLRIEMVLSKNMEKIIFVGRGIRLETIDENIEFVDMCTEFENLCKNYTNEG